MQSLTQPELLLKPFADSGDKNTIPTTNTDTSNPQRADLTNGFPEITSKLPSAGGLPPERKDFNALGYLTTTYDYFYQAGGTFTFNSTISSAIGGYPLGARLWYTDNNGATVILRSTKGNNTDNFITTPSYIGSSWVQETPALSWNNTWTGNNTFSGSVSLGSSATATTPSASDNSTKVATTAWLNLSGVKTKIMGWLVPNWSSKTGISSGYQATGTGWVVWKTATNNKNSYLSIDGVEIARTDGYPGDWTDSAQTQILIGAGQTVTFSGGTCYFVPCMGG